MPYQGPNDPALPTDVQGWAEGRRRQWVAVWNAVYGRCIEAGGSATHCERQAYPQAYGATKETKMAELKTETLSGIDILRVGEGFQGNGCPAEGCKFTTEDLDSIVDAYWATKGARTPPVKLGHDENQALLQEDGYPAAGWVANLRRLGDKLYADLLDVPQRLAELMKAGAYRAVSVELDKGMSVNGSEYPLTLTALALLGADLPAVDSLTGIASLYQSLQLDYKADGATVLFQRDMPMPDMPPDKKKKMPTNMAEWDTAWINNLPDSAFAYVTPGEKDSEGKTVPHSNRYLPHHNGAGPGNVDLPHLLNALARVSQTSLPPDAKQQATRHLQGHARSQGVGEQGG